MPKGLIKPIVLSDAQKAAQKKILNANVAAVQMTGALKGRPLPSVNVITNDSLPYDAWKEYDAAIMRAARSRLVIFNDLVAAGLTRTVSLGTTLAYYQKSSEMTQADISMHGDTDGEMDSLTIDADGTPVPIIHKDWQVDMRSLLASQNSGESLDTTSTERAGRVVAEGIENLIFNGGTTQVGGLTVRGLTTAPNRNTKTNLSDWTSTAAGYGEAIIADVVDMLKRAYADNYFGPFNLYVPKNFWAAIQRDYSPDKGDNTVMDRIMAFADINAVRPGDALADNNVVLVQMTSDVIQAVVGSFLVNSQYTMGSPMKYKFMTWAAAAALVKDDANDASGVVHGSM